MAYSPNLLQLTHVLQRLYRRLGGKVTTATNGTNSTVEDTKLAAELEEGNEDDLFNGGTVIISDTTDNAAPIGEYGRITDYEAGTQTLTFSPAASAVVGSGDTVIIAPPDFPLYDVIEQVNDALTSLGEVPVPDVSLTTLDGVTEYDLPAAAVGKQLLDVEVQTILGEVNNNGFVPIETWGTVPPSSAGAAGRLVLAGLGAGYTIRVTYLGIHPRLDTFDSFISGYIHPELIHAAAYAHILQWKNDRDALAGGADDASLALEQKAWSQFDRARMLYPVKVPPRRIQGMPHYTTYDQFNLYPPYAGFG